MNIEAVAAVFLIFVPLAFNAFFLLLGRLFDYPNILRRPTEDILNGFQAGGVGLKLVWYGFMLTAVMFAPLVVLLGQVLAADGHAVIPSAIVIGVLASIVQILGLARWPFLVPALARAYTDPASTPTTREATQAVFESFHRYLGVGIGECLGYLLTGAWSVLVGVAMLQSSAFEAWIGWPGIVIGLFLVGGSLEFVGHFEEHGWKLAGSIVPIAYIAWSLWLIVSGLVLLFA